MMSNTHEPTTLRRIVVPLDGSELAEQALPYRLRGRGAPASATRHGISLLAPVKDTDWSVGRLAHLYNESARALSKIHPFEVLFYHRRWLTLMSGVCPLRLTCEP